MPLLPQYDDAGCSDCRFAGDRRAFLARMLSVVAAAALLPDSAHAEAQVVVTQHALPDRDGLVRYPIPAADGATIDSANEVIIVRAAGQCMAFALSCPHQRALLRIKGGTTAFQCPKHKSEYRIDGAFIRGRATRNMDRLTIRRDGAELVVDIESEIRSDDDAATWAAAVVRL